MPTPELYAQYAIEAARKSFEDGRTKPMQRVVTGPEVTIKPITKNPQSK